MNMLILGLVSHLSMVIKTIITLNFWGGKEIEDGFDENYWIRTILLFFKEKNKRFLLKLIF